MINVDTAGSSFFFSAANITYEGKWTKNSTEMELSA